MNVLVAPARKIQFSSYEQRLVGYTPDLILLLVASFGVCIAFNPSHFQSHRS